MVKHANAYQPRLDMARSRRTLRRARRRLLAAVEILTGVLVVLESILGPLVVAFWEAAGQ